MKRPAYATDMRIRTIVVGIDFSEYTQTALFYATTIARPRGSKIILLHVVDPVIHGMAVDAPRSSEGALLHNAEHKLQELAQFLAKNGIEHEIIVHEGGIRETLFKVAKEHKADLLAIGCHGRDRIDRQVLGSAAEQILRLSPCPVMVAGPEVERPEKQIFLCEDILFPTNMGESSLAALDQIAHFAMAHDADLTLLHVMPRYTSRKDKTAASNKLDAIAKKMQRPGLAVHSKIRTGVISEAILAQSHESHSSAIVLGITHSKDFHKGTPAGLIYTLISQATCPIFTFQGNHALHRKDESNHRKNRSVGDLKAS
ncbi:MAG: universal stress protein [Acidobacteriaceae bacterium]